MHFGSLMRIKVRRRRDGVVQIGRESPWRLVFDPAAGVMLCCFAGCAALIAGLAATLVAFPLAVGLTLPFVTLGIWGGRLARSTRIAAPQLTDPPPRRVA
jgi:hypothetical protein